jgi:hypothetical protein
MKKIINKRIKGGHCMHTQRRKEKKQRWAAYER